jgi:SAM-dependent methyltransferase
VTVTTGGYVFDDAWHAERARLGSLEAALDPGTIRHLTDLGVRPGWRCVEVGAGAGSIAWWLAEQVTPGGSVLAVDLQTNLLEQLKHPALEVRRHDIVNDQLPTREFDLVHTRWMLHWPADRAVAIGNMVEALRPGGVLLAEEPDFGSLFDGLPDPLQNIVVVALGILEDISGGMNCRYGRRLHDDLAAAGLVELQAVGRAHLIHGGDDTSGVAWLRFTIEKVRDRMIADGMDERRLNDALALLDNPTFNTPSPLTLAVWGRRSD